MGADVLSLDEARARLRPAPFTTCPLCGDARSEPEPEPVARHISDAALLDGEL